MIEHGADINNLTDDSGESPLHMAVYIARVPAVELLIKAGAFVNATTTNDLDTPLHFIGKSENTTTHLLKTNQFWQIDNYDDDLYNIAELLIKSGADLNAKNANGETPLDLVTNKNSKTMKFMAVQAKYIRFDVLI